MFNFSKNFQRNQPNKSIWIFCAIFCLWIQMKFSPQQCFLTQDSLKAFGPTWKSLISVTYLYWHLKVVKSRFAQTILIWNGIRCGIWYSLKKNKNWLYELFSSWLMLDYYLFPLCWKFLLPVMQNTQKYLKYYTFKSFKIFLFPLHYLLIKSWN